MTYLTPDRDALAKAECPDCGHSPFDHHIAGGCTVTTYGPPEDGFQPSEHCGCDRPADDALIASGAVIDASTLTQPCVAGREFHDEWIEQLCALIPEGDESRFSNPEGAAEAIILDCFRVYAARPDAATLADDAALVAALMHRWGCEDADEDAYDAARSDLATIAAALTERGQA